MGIGSHQSERMFKDEWLTPPEILKSLGPFDLDPCAPEKRPWDMAKTHYTNQGLMRPWVGRVWLNPPYGSQTGIWLHKLAEHGNGIALIFARTETEMFFSQVWKKATALFFLEGRIYFYNVDGIRGTTNSGAPSVFIAYGEDNAERLRTSNLRGVYIKRWEYLP